MRQLFLLAVMMSTATFGQASPEPTTQPTTNPNLPTLFLVGDSTVRNRTSGQMGWGDSIAVYFDRSRINVINRALGGRSSRTFQTHGLWDGVLKEAKPGDFVIIQLGHNDGGPINDDFRARGTIHGVGEELEEIDNILTKQHEVVHTYGWYMRKYISDARAKGMTPVVCSLVPRCPRPPGTQPSTEPAAIHAASYREWAGEVARAEGVHFIDLHGLILARYEKLTPGQIKARYFTEGADFTHTNPAGAELNAECVIQGLRQLKGCGLTDYLLPSH